MDISLFWRLKMVEPDGEEVDHIEIPGQTIVQPKPKVKRPPLYKVILLNDDYTPMDFVVGILKRFFSKTDAEAQKIMLAVHDHGAGLAGVYPFELAETKVYQVNEYSRGHRFPLKCIMEKEEQDDAQS